LRYLREEQANVRRLQEKNLELQKSLVKGEGQKSGTVNLAKKRRRDPHAVELTEEQR
jgi:hypothetical protein